MHFTMKEEVTTRLLTAIRYVIFIFCLYGVAKFTKILLEVDYEFFSCIRNKRRKNSI